MAVSGKNIWRAAKWTAPLLIVAALLAGLFSGADPTSEMARTLDKIAAFDAVYQAYKREFGSYPPVTENFRVVKIFQGENPRQKEFFAFKNGDLNVNGEVVDGWETPFRFDYEEGAPVILSAGEDRVFGTDDDMTN